jgi:hypothetical protein
MDPEPELVVMTEEAVGGVLLDHTDAAEVAVADILPDRFDALVSVILHPELTPPSAGWMLCR